MSIHVIIPLASLVSYLPIIFLVLRGFTVARVRRVFALYLIAATAWSLSSFMAHYDPYPGQTHICVKFIIVTCVWMTATYYHFVRAFVRRPNGLGVLLAYVFVVAVAILVAVEDFPRSAETVDGALHVEYGPFFYLLPATLFPLTGAAAVSLIQRFRSDRSERRRIGYLLVGASVVVIGAATNLSSSLGMYPLDHVANLINAVIIFYAVLVYQLLNIRVALKRSLPYWVVGVTLVSVYALSISLILRTTSWPTYGYVGVAGGLALLFAIMFPRLLHITQQAVNRLIYASTYDYRQTMLNFSDRMSNVLNLDELAENMLYPITKALNAKRAYLFLPEGEGGDFVARFAQPTVTQSEPLLRMGKDHPIPLWLSQKRKTLHRETIDIDPMFKGLWQSEGDEIDALELVLFCPIMRKGSLIGILGLSRKHSERPYSADDVDLLSTMATEAAIVMENAMMLDNLREQQDHVERLLAKTVLAQEEERKRIAIELHDSVAQWLVGASYRAQSCGFLLSEEDNEKAQAELAEIESTIDRSLKEIRRVMSGLHPPALEELGLVHALRQILDGLKPEGIAYHFETEGEPVRLHPSIELAVYRVVQEAVNNIRKHSGATAAVLKLRFERQKVTVEVHDNGSGFNLSRTMKGAVSVGHMGLLGMKERAGMLGGDIKIKTRPGSGTVVLLTLPANVPAAARVEAGGHSPGSH